MTQFVDLTAWVDTLLGRLNGAAPDMVRTEVRNAVREFFVESTVWRVDAVLNTVAGEPTIDLNTGVNTGEVIFVLDVKYKERTLTPTPDFPFGWEDTGDPHWYWSPEPQLLRLAPIPAVSETGVLRTKLSLRPLQDRVPSWIQSQFFKVILDGSLARLYGAPKKPYSSPSLSDRHGGSFRSGIARAKSMANRRFTTAPHPYRFPQGWSPVV